MSKLKFMGSSHEHQLLADDTFGGRLATPLPQTVLFNRDNGWVVDTEEVGLSDAAVAILLEDEASFRDVTGHESIPPNLHQTTFLGIPEDANVAPVTDDYVAPEAPVASEVPVTPPPPTPEDAQAAADADADLAPDPLEEQAAAVDMESDDEDDEPAAPSTPRRKR